MQLVSVVAKWQNYGASSRWGLTACNSGMTRQVLAFRHRPHLAGRAAVEDVTVSELYSVYSSYTILLYTVLLTLSITKPQELTSLGDCQDG